MQTESIGYSAVSVVVHWVAAILVIALFLTHEGERGSAAYTFHVSVGAVIGLFLLWRVWRRLRLGMAEKPVQHVVFNVAFQIVTYGFLIAIVVVVITGYLLPWTIGRPLDIAGLFEIPSPMEASRGLHEFVEKLHERAGQIFVPLLALHILGAAKHAFIDRDGVARRMFRSVAGGR